MTHYPNSFSCPFLLLSWNLERLGKLHSTISTIEPLFEPLFYKKNTWTIFSKQLGRTRYIRMSMNQIHNENLLHKSELKLSIHSLFEFPNLSSWLLQTLLFFSLVARKCTNSRKFVFWWLPLRFLLKTRIFLVSGRIFSSSTEMFRQLKEYQGSLKHLPFIDTLQFYWLPYLDGAPNEKLMTCEEYKAKLNHFSSS